MKELGFFSVTHVWGKGKKNGKRRISKNLDKLYSFERDARIDSKNTGHSHVYEYVYGEATKEGDTYRLDSVALRALGLENLGSLLGRLMLSFEKETRKDKGRWLDVYTRVNIISMQCGRLHSNG